MPLLIPSDRDDVVQQFYQLRRLCVMNVQTQSKVRPIHDRVLIKRTESEQMTPGGIIIPDTAQEKTQEGIVVATGDGKTANDGNVRSLRVKAGDRVLFGKYSGTEIKVGGQEYLILKEDEILGIIE
jgi:chaperonin GroES